MKHETDFTTYSNAAQKATAACIPADCIIVPQSLLSLATKAIAYSRSLAGEHTHLISLAMMENIKRDDADADADPIISQLLDNKTSRLQALAEFYDDAAEAGAEMQFLLNAHHLAEREKRAAAKRDREARAVALTEEMYALAGEARDLDPASPHHSARFLWIWKRLNAITSEPHFFVPLIAHVSIVETAWKFRREIQEQYNAAAREAGDISAKYAPNIAPSQEDRERLTRLRERCDDLTSDMQSIGGAIKFAK